MPPEYYRFTYALRGLYVDGNGRITWNIPALDAYYARVGWNPTVVRPAPPSTMSRCPKR